MPIYKSYLLLFILLGSLSLQAQEITTADLAGEWIGYDSKGQKVTLVFIEPDKVQTLSMDQTHSFNYIIKANANNTYLLLTPLTGRKSKTIIKWPLVYDGNDQLQINFPQIPSIIFTRKQEDKIKLSRFSTAIGDSIIQYTYLMRYKEDSVKAVKTVHLPKPLPLTIADTILTDVISSDQLELKKGWSGSNYSFGVVFNFAPSTGTFFIDKLDFHKAIDQPFSVCVSYWKNKLMNFFSLDKEDFVYPTDAETILSMLKRFTDLSR